MELDFTAIIGNLALDSSEDPPAIEQAAKLATQSQREQQELDRARDVYNTYQNNIKASEALRAEILKGLAGGESHTVILEKSILCIGLMTHDKVFATQAANML